MTADSWFLILVIAGHSHGGHVAVDHIEFPNKSACFAARDELLKSEQRGYRIVDAHCVARDPRAEKLSPSNGYPF